MAALDSWHPVLLSRELGKRPAAVRLCDRELVLFRTRGGSVGALEDCCPHRRMRLSLGRVERDRLVCPYHGWSYDTQGQGKCPGMPSLRPRARHLEVIERNGATWVKEAGSPATVPVLDYPGFYLQCLVRYQLKAPLELVLDNFCEVEHTPTGHQFFGYGPDVADVQSSVELTDKTVQVVNVGLQRRVPPLTATLLGIHTDDRFTAAWTTYFAPVFNVYDMFWENPKTGAERPGRIKEVVFFSPAGKDECNLVAYFFSTRNPAGRLGLNRLLQAIFVLLVRYEFTLDRWLVESLADKNTRLRGCQLGRFDRVLVENRARIQSVYFGQSAADGDLAQTPVTPNGEPSP
jgi:vanillate O-demethylase monooxygenase subunit